MPTVEVLALGDGRFVVVAGAERKLAYAVRRGAATWVFFDGKTWIIDARGESSSPSARPHEDTALAAPMPATVVSINVSEGQTVKAGDLLITLEAMKMELAIIAPRDAKVRRVACQVGELVQPGVPVVEIE